MIIYSKMENDSWNDLTFGISKYPLKYGLDLEVGNGYVVPEIKYFPRTEYSSKNVVKEEYRKITHNILKRATDLGLDSIQLETEQTFEVTKNPALGGEITSIQKSIMEEYSKKYGLKSALRVTIADVRNLAGKFRSSNEYSLMLESFEECAANGADILSIESIGGKEVFNYSVIRQDIEGALFAIGVLGCLDMKLLWKEITRISKKYGILAGGDTDCAHSNSAMILAGGMHDNTLSHTFAAAIRAMGASRSLVAYEEGATGPGKDCGYENVILKAITGLPMSMEGKTSASAHSSLIGNVSAAACDLWSNEQVENIRLFGGYAPQVFTEILAYDAFLLNKALESGHGNLMRDLLVASNPFDPQSIVLSPEGAWNIGKAITQYPQDYLMRSTAAVLEALNVVEKGYESSRHKLPDNEKRILDKIRETLKELPRYETFIEKNIEKFTDKTCFSPQNYGL